MGFVREYCSKCEKDTLKKTVCDCEATIDRKEDVFMPRTIGNVNFLTVKETAERLGVHRNTVRNWLRSGKEYIHEITITDPFSGKLYFSEDKINNIIDKFSGVGKEIK